MTNCPICGKERPEVYYFNGGREEEMMGGDRCFHCIFNTNTLIGWFFRGFKNPIFVIQEGQLRAILPQYDIEIDGR